MIAAFEGEQRALTFQDRKVRDISFVLESLELEFCSFGGFGMSKEIAERVEVQEHLLKVEGIL